MKTSDDLIANFTRAALALSAFLLLILSSNSVYASGKDNTTTAETGLTINDDTFHCIREMTKVRGFYVDNLKDTLDATVAVANSATGGKYPAGSVVQLVPGEVMVKHNKGFSPATNDWEFFELDVSATQSKIRKRGFADVVNRFGGNCFGCHIKAKPQWDFLCEKDHGCDPIPLSNAVLELLQKTDPRCDNNEKLTPSELEVLKTLQQAMSTP